MKQASLQKIEDHYQQKGLRGAELRRALEEDVDYQRILAHRSASLTKQFAISEKDLQKYVLSTDEDWEILGKIYELENKPLDDHDRDLVRLIRAQLERDWRKPLSEKLDELLRKY